MDVYKKVILSVTEHYGITLQTLLGTKRTKSLAEARHVVCYLLRTHTPWSFPEIGNRLHRDHTSVMHAVRRVAESPELIRAAAVLADKIHGTNVPVVSFGYGDGESPLEGHPEVFEKALKITGNFFGVSRDQVLSPSHGSSAVTARAIAIQLVRNRTSWSSTELAERFQKDHSTVLSALSLVQNSPGLKRCAEQLDRRMAVP